MGRGNCVEPQARRYTRQHKGVVEGLWGSRRSPLPLDLPSAANSGWRCSFPLCSLSSFAAKKNPHPCPPPSVATDLSAPFRGNSSAGGASRFLAGSARGADLDASARRPYLGIRSGEGRAGAAGRGLPAPPLRSHRMAHERARGEGGKPPLPSLSSTSEWRGRQHGSLSLMSQP